MSLRTGTSGDTDADRVYQYLVADIDRVPAHFRQDLRSGWMSSFVTYLGLQDKLKLEPYQVMQALEHLHARGFIDVTHWRGHGVDYFFRRSIESRVA